jgi:hypothetical protein
MWLTDRFKLDGDDEQGDLAAALDAPASMSANGLRALALTRLTTMIREAAGVPTALEPVGPAPQAEASIFGALRDSGFIDFDAPEGEPDDAGPQLTPGTRIVLVSGESSDVPIDTVAVPLATLLVADRAGVPAVSLLVAEDRPEGDATGPEFVVALRNDEDADTRLSTVDNIGDFAGRLAVVLAIVDLGDGRIGHYGRGPGAQRLLPAPPEP